MSGKALMNLKVLLPFCVLATKSGVSGIVAETISGSIGILPHRLDCVAALIPGILVYKDDDGIERYIAVDQGILIKTGFMVLVSVRNAVCGSNLEKLQETVERDYQLLNEQEKKTRLVVSKIESAFYRKLTRYGNG